MKANKSFIQMLLVGAFVFLTFMISSCSKNEDTNVTPNNQSLQSVINKKVKGMNFIVTAKDGKKVVVSGNGNVQSETSFAATNSGGNNFASGDANTSFASGESGTNYSTGAGTSTSFELLSGFSQGGGSFNINGKNVTLDYVYCSEDDSSIVGDLADFEDGVTILIGIKGNFESAEEASVDYICVMFILDDKPTGAYNIDLSYLEGEGEGEPNLDRFAFIQIADFSELSGDPEEIDNAKLFVSTKGAVNAAGGTYAFNGVDFAELKFDEFDDFYFGKKVKGSGNLVCQ